MAWASIMADLNLRVNKRDAERQIGEIDTGPAGKTGGDTYGRAFGKSAGTAMRDEHGRFLRDATSTSGRGGRDAGAQFGSFFSVQMGKNLRVGLTRTMEGIGPAILGLSTKVMAGITAGGALAGTLPALAAGAGAGAVAAGGVGLIAASGKALVGTKAQQGPLYAQAQEARLALQNAFLGAAGTLKDTLSQAFGELPRIVQSISPALRQAFAGAGTLVQPLLQGLAGMAREVLPLLGQAFRAVAPLLQPMISGLTGLITGLLPGLITLLRASQPAIAAVSDVLGQLGLGLGAMFAQFAPVLTVSGSVLKSLGDIIAQLLPVIAQLAGTFAATLAPVLAAFSRAVQAILPFLNILAQVVADLAAAMLGDLTVAFNALAQLLTAIAPALTVFARALAGVFTMLENSGVFAMIGTALESIVAPLGQLISAILTGLAPILPLVIGFLAQLAATLAGALGQAIAAVLPPLTVLATVVLQTLAQILPVVLPVLTQVLGLFTAAVVFAITSVANALAALVNAIPPSVLGPLVTGLIGLKLAMMALPAIIALVSGAWQLLGVVFASNPVGLIITGLVLLGVALYTAWTRSATFRDIVIGVFTAVQAAVGAVAAWFTGPFVAFFTGAWAAITGAFSGAVAMISGVFTAIRTAIVGPFTTWWAANGEAIKQIWASIWGVLGPVFTTAWAIVLLAVRTGWAILQAIFTTAWGIIRALWDAGWAALTGVVAAVWGGITGVARAGWAALTAIFTTAAAIISASWSLLWNVLSAVVRVAWAAVATLLKVGWDIIVGIFTVFINLVTGRWGAAWTALRVMFEQIWNAIRGFLGVVLSSIQQVISAAWSFINAVTQAVWNGIRAFLAAIWSAIWAVINAALGAVKALLSAAWQAISGTVTAVWNGIRTFFTGWWNAIAAFIGAKGNWIRDFLGGTWNTIKNTAISTWNALLTGIKTIWDNLVKTIGSPVYAVIHFVINPLGAGINTIVRWLTGSSPVGRVSENIPHWQRGARVPGYGGGDTYPAWVRGGGAAMLEPGELVMPKEATRDPRQAALASEYGVPGFQRGGIVGGILGNLIHSIPVIGPLLTGPMLTDAMKLIPGPVGSALASISGLAGSGASQIPGGGGWADAVRTVPGRLASQTFTKLSGMVRDWLTAHVSTGSSIVDYARQFVGKVPYVWGGDTTAGWDCSGMISYLYRHFGIMSGRMDAAGFQRWAKSSAPTPGGMAFFGSPAHHIGLVMNATQMINALGQRYGTIISALQMGDNSGYGIPPRGWGSAGVVAGGPAPTGYNAIVELGRSMAASAGWVGPEWQALFSLWQRESGWNPNAVNPGSGAAGIPQDITGNMHGGAAGQIAWGIAYIKARYRDALNAWAHSQATGWYHGGGQVRGFARGGLLTEPVLGVGRYSQALYSFGERGREWVMPDTAAPAGTGGDGAAAPLIGTYQTAYYGTGDTAEAMREMTYTLRRVRQGAYTRS